MHGDPRIVFRSDDNGTVQGLVAAGVGIAIVPRLTVDEADESIAVVDLGDRVPPRLIGIAWHRDRRRTRHTARTHRRCERRRDDAGRQDLRSARPRRGGRPRGGQGGGVAGRWGGAGCARAGSGSRS